MPSPTPIKTEINSDISTGSTVINLGSSFLERLGNQATNGFTRGLRTNPGGGGASESAEGPRYRTWGELYGITSATGPQADYFGDKRRTAGGVAGFGARIVPGVNVGFSVDQSRTSVDVPLALQSATLDLTQLGVNASIDKGPWTWAIALVHGFGNIGSSRDTGGGFASARYGVQIDGALSELDYYWTKDQSRIVPKVGLEYVHASTGAFQEMGGLDALTVSGATMERSRLLAGAEIGHYWILDHQQILDLSAYGKFVDNFSQQFSSVLVSLGPESITVTGIGESQYGADAGASASLSITSTARLYFNYDGKFRSNLQSHQGTLGLEIRW
ncbi:autotransporter outer membrane beta-barrel domain-containing protein [Bradyrhizobium sp.]|uniref:autotransporter outer membrane beta-barrel domain-containing protein n=1 Tax=Bradyrhizobium sp. TaxID=376 RepID=UPI0039C8618F